MKIYKIMQVCSPELIKSKGIHENENIYNLNLEDIILFDSIIPIVNDEKLKIGTVSKELLNGILLALPLQMLTEVLEKVSSAVIVLDKEGRVVFLNDAYVQITGIPHNKRIGYFLKDFEPNAGLLTVLQTKEPIVMEKKYIKAYDKYISGKIHPIFIKGQFEGAVSMFVDSTELLVLNQKVEQANLMVYDLGRKLRSKEVLDELEIIGQNPTFLRALERASIIADTDVPVMIRGENGVGKDLLARFIHKKSKRADKSFVTVNCAAIPENLIESELFGYEEGSFTGAKIGGKVGKFEIANGGTLFLDEVGDMPLLMQSKLLRAIQDKEIEKIGSQRTISIDVRIITATNQPLEEMMEKKTFRKDLYYRINTLSLHIPSLKERKDDIILYTNYFLKLFNEQYQKNVSFSNDVLLFMHRHSWPGNVRELKSFVEQAVIVCEGRIYDKKYILDLIESSQSKQYDDSLFQPLPWKNAVEDAEKRILQGALVANNNNKARTIEMLGISKRTFYRKMSQYGFLEKPQT